MKLELKHLAPYLPYDLQMAYIIRGKIVEIGDLNKVFIYRDATHPIRYGINYNDAEHEWMFKPILRPLSSMTKEEFAELKNKLDGGVLLKLTPEGDIYIKCNDELYLYEVNILNDFLFSNHFDVFGLIDKGLAIEK